MNNDSTGAPGRARWRVKVDRLGYLAMLIFIEAIWHFYGLAWFWTKYGLADFGLVFYNYKISLDL